MKTIVINIPLPYYKRNSKALYTMNIHRNCHHRVAHKFKVDYAKIVRSELNKFDNTDMGTVNLEYHIHFKPTMKGNAKHIDLMNVGSIIDKVVSDEIVSYGLVEDDDIGYITNVKFYADPYSTSDYCEVRITNE